MSDLALSTCLKAGLREKFRKRTRSKRTLATPEVSAGPNASTLSRGSRGSLGDLKDLIGWSVQPKEQPKTQLTWSPNIDDWKALGQSLLDRTLGREPKKPKTKYEKAKIYASEKLVEVKNQLRYVSKVLNQNSFFAHIRRQVRTGVIFILVWKILIQKRSRFWSFQ